MDYSLFIGIHYMNECSLSHDSYFRSESSRLSPCISTDPIRANRYGNAIYHFGIIDILTTYNLKKKTENLLKRFIYSQEKISAVNPEVYGNRLNNFVKNHLYE